VRFVEWINVEASLTGRQSYPYVRTHVLTGSIFLDYLLAPLPPVQLGLNKTVLESARRVPILESVQSFEFRISRELRCWEIRIVSRGVEFYPRRFRGFV